MKIFVINLKKSKDRRDNIISQFKKFNITNYEFIDAVYGKDLSNEELKTKYDDRGAKKWVRSLSLNEIGCSLSHNIAFEKIIKENKRCLIFEDDIILNDKFNPFINTEIESKTDIVFFGLATTNCIHENLPKTYKYENILYSTNVNFHTTACYLKDTYETFGGINFYDIDERSYTIDFVTQTHAYAPSPEACKKLLALNTPVKFMADMLWNFVKFSLKVPQENIIIQNLSGFKSNISETRLNYHKDFNETFSERYKKRVLSKDYNK